MATVRVVRHSSTHPASHSDQPDLLTDITFWGWLRALLQYSFYPVVANAYIYVFGSVLIHFVDRAGTDFSGLKIAVLFLPLLFLLIAFTWGLLKVPSLCNSLFTGKSGESALPL